ncbi:MAG: sulfur carrier protein ThiS [bacterium]
MKLKINGEEETIDRETLTVTDLLTVKEVKMPDMVSVELNGEMLERDTFETTSLKEGDEIEFLYFMGGGMI